MKIKSNIQTLFVAPLFILTFNSCKDDCVNDKDIIMDLYPQNIAKVMPYTGNETLRFLKNKSDTISFVGEGRKTSYSREQTQSPCIEFEQLQNMNVSFHSSKNDETIGYDYYVMSRAFSNAAMVDVNYNRKLVGTYDNIYFFTNQRPEIKKDTACGVPYDSVSKFTHKLGNLTFKPGFGIIKFTINDNMYELIP